MKELTLQQAIENKFTLEDCVRYYFPNESDEFCDFALWEKTCFPFCMETTLKQLYNLFLNEEEKTSAAKSNE